MQEIKILVEKGALGGTTTKKLHNSSGEEDASRRNKTELSIDTDRELSRQIGILCKKYLKNVEYCAWYKFPSQLLSLENFDYHLFILIDSLSFQKFEDIPFGVTPDHEEITDYVSNASVKLKNFKRFLSNQNIYNNNDCEGSSYISDTIDETEQSINVDESEQTDGEDGADDRRVLLRNHGILMPIDLGNRWTLVWLKFNNSKLVNIFQIDSKPRFIGELSYNSKLAIQSLLCHLLDIKHVDNLVYSFGYAMPTMEDEDLNNDILTFLNILNVIQSYKTFGYSTGLSHLTCDTNQLIRDYKEYKSFYLEYIYNENNGDMESTDDEPDVLQQDKEKKLTRHNGPLLTTTVTDRSSGSKHIDTTCNVTRDLLLDSRPTRAVRLSMKRKLQLEEGGGDGGPEDDVDNSEEEEDHDTARQQSKNSTKMDTKKQKTKPTKLSLTDSNKSSMDATDSKQPKSTTYLKNFFNKQSKEELESFGPCYVTMKNLKEIRKTVNYDKSHLKEIVNEFKKTYDDIQIKFYSKWAKTDNKKNKKKQQSQIDENEFEFPMYGPTQIEYEIINSSKVVATKSLLKKLAVMDIFPDQQQMRAISNARRWINQRFKYDAVTKTVHYLRDLDVIIPDYDDIPYIVMATHLHFECMDSGSTYNQVRRNWYISKKAVNFIVERCSRCN